MKTEEFNTKRANAWSKKLSDADARIMLIVAMKQDNKAEYIHDNNYNAETIANYLEELAKSIRIRAKLLN